MFFEYTDKTLIHAGVRGLAVNFVHNGSGVGEVSDGEEEMGSWRLHRALRIICFWAVVCFLCCLLLALRGVMSGDGFVFSLGCAVLVMAFPFLLAIVLDVAQYGGEYDLWGCDPGHALTGRGA